MTPFQQLNCALNQDPQARGADFAQRCQEHGLAALLYYHARHEGRLHDLPAQHLETLKRSFLLGQLRSQQMGLALESVLLEARRRSLDVMVLKGAHLAAYLYETPALRPMGDLDLLIRPQAWSAAERLLRDLGYLPQAADGYHQAFFSPTDGVQVELHKGLGAEHIALPLEDIWRQAQEAAFGSATGWVMCPQHLPLYLIFHLCKHGFRAPLRALWDLKLCSLETMERPQTRTLGLAHDLLVQTLGVFTGQPPSNREAEIVRQRILTYSQQTVDLEEHLQSPGTVVRKLLLGTDPGSPDLTLAGVHRRLTTGLTALATRRRDGDLRRVQREGYELEMRLGLRRPRRAVWPARLEAWIGLLAIKPALRLFGAMALLRWFALEQEPPADRAGDPEALVSAVDWATRHQPTRTLCLPRSLVLCGMLRRRGLGGRVQLGGRRHQGQFQAHAWVMIGDRSLDNGPDADMAPFR